MQKRLFVKNAAILSATSLLLKTIGIFFRVWLSGKLGGEGMGLYQLLFSLYVLGATLATTGISTAVTRLVADSLAENESGAIPRILRRSVGLSLLAAVASTALFYGCAPFLGNVCLHDPRAVPAIRILSLGFPFMGVSACLKGYFLARRNTLSPSLAQIVEQLARIGIIAALFFRFRGASLTVACAVVMGGDVLSEVISCAFTALCFLKDRRTLPPKTGNRRAVVRPLLSIAVPITAGRYLSTALRTAENLLVPTALAAFLHDRAVGLSQFGTLKGMALPLLFFPASFLAAFSTLLIPEMSEALALGQKLRVKYTVSHTLHITLTASVLFGGVFFACAAPLGQLLYHSDEVGFYLRVLAPLVPVMYLESVADGILKGLNQQTRSLLYSVADSGLRIALILLLVPRTGMGGFLFVMLLSNFFTCSLNVRRLCIVSGARILWGKSVLFPALCAAVGAATATLVCGRCLPPDTLWQTVGCGLIATAVTAGGLFLTKSLTPEDLHLK